MKLRSKVEIRRCRPLLGTFVEITASDAGDKHLNLAANAAFAAIEKIQELMSPHDPESELSLLNREAAKRPVKLSAETFDVLRRADRIASQSGGAFDYTIAPTLARWGLLPASLKRRSPGCWRDVLLLPGRNVRFLRPLAIDLGGIAKGFAVDKAIKILHSAGVASGVVSAGGDLRVFGRENATVHFRHPSCPCALLKACSIRESALATSSPVFSQKVWHGRRVSHLINPLQGRAITGSVSVTVQARECWVADALTKVVLNSPESADELLRTYEAKAFILTE